VIKNSSSRPNPSLLAGRDANAGGLRQMRPVSAAAWLWRRDTRDK